MVTATDYPFPIHVDSSIVATGCILIQQFPEGKKLSRLTLVYTTKQKKCPLSNENYAELYQLFRQMNSLLLDHHFPFISNVIKNQSFIYENATDNYHIASSDVRSSLRNSGT